MKWLARLNRTIDAGLGALLASLTVAMTLTVLWQVSTRLYSRLTTHFDWPLWIEPSQWTEELAGFQLAWVAMLGAAYALRKGEHIGLDSLYRTFSPRGQALAYRFVQACIVGFGAVMLVGGSYLVWLTLQLQQTTPALHWSMGWVYVVAPISGGLMILFALERVFDDEENAR